MIRTTLRAAAAAIVVVLALAGCSPDSRPLARVGRHTLTVGDFLRTARRSGEGQQLPAAQAKPLLLEDMVRNELLLVAAEANGLDTNAVSRERRRSLTEQALLAALSEQIAPHDPGVTAAEVRKLHEWRRTQSEVQLVYAPDSSSILVARHEIEQGRPIATVANEFGGVGILPPGGRIGFRVPGTLPQPLDDAMRTQPVGSLGGPYHAPMGWFLVLVLGRMPAQVQPFEQQRASLENVLRQRKRQTVLLTRVAQLAPAYHMSIEPDAGVTLFRMLTPGRVGGMDESPPSAAQRARVLARFDGGDFTVGDAWEDLARPDLGKPNSSMVPSLTEWVRERTIARIALVEARRRHLGEDPEVAGQIADQVNDAVLQAEYAWLVAGVPSPDEATLRATWEPVKDRYPMLSRAHVLWLTVADTAKAIAIGQRTGGATLRDAARAVDPSLVVHDETLRFPTSDPRWASAQSALQHVGPGELAAPDFTEDGIRLVQLVDQSQGPLSWDQLPQDVRQSVTNNLLQRARDQRLAAYADSLRRAINPVLLSDALRGVPWPVPPVATP